MEKNRKKILFLGPVGSYSQVAVNNFKKEILHDIETEPVSTIKKILEITDKNKNFFAVVPVENSIEGIVRETVDNLLNSKGSLKILSETVVKIEHCLLSKDKKENIKYIISHPQALAQCGNYISKNFNKDIELIASSSTSKSAIEASKKQEKYASVANKLCAELYNLNILDKNINDNKKNYTRFILLGHEDLALPCNRTSVAFSTKNKPGALLEILKIFKKYNLNLIYLESRPSKKNLGEYIFYADIDKGEHCIKEAIKELSEKSKMFKIFGSYKTI